MDTAITGTAVGKYVGELWAKQLEVATKGGITETGIDESAACAWWQWVAADREAFVAGFKAAFAEAMRRD